MQSKYRKMHLYKSCVHASTWLMLSVLDADYTAPHHVPDAPLLYTVLDSAARQ